MANQLLEYQGYLAEYHLDERDGILVGRVINTRDIISFEGRSVKELLSDFHNSIKHYIKACKEEGVPPEKPYSGKFVVRVEPALHRQLAEKAAQKGESLNAMIKEALEDLAA
ncbi:MAG: type II toxin-antitoxin system HicB family antitoxin [bacterium]|nr:type II toxin-antitoxin system HicB family antitoxin [bacterium]